MVRRRLIPVALLAVLLAFALRVFHLDYQSLWSDEGISLLRSSQPLGRMLADMPVEHVPGYFVLLHCWLALAGGSDFALRYLSLMASVLAVSLTYRLGSDLGSRPAGLLAALLLATSEFQVWYAQEARMYSWLLAAALASTWLLWRLWRYLERPPVHLRDPRLLGILAGYVLATAATLYLHYYGFLLPLAQGIFVLYHLAATRNWRRFPVWVAAGLGVLALFGPWLPRVPALLAFPGFREPADPWTLPRLFLVAYTAGDAMPWPWRSFVPILYLGLAVVGLWAWWRENRFAAALLLCAAAVPIAAAMALALRKPDYHERYTLFASAPLFLLSARGLLTWPDLRARLAAAGAPVRSLRRAILIVGLLSLALLGLILAGNSAALVRIYGDAGVQKADYRGLVHHLAELQAPGDVILADHLDPQQVFAHYYAGGLPLYDVRAVEDGTEAEVDALLGPLTTGAGRAWDVRFDKRPGPVEVWLATHGWQAERTYWGAGDLQLTLYGLPGARQVEQPVDLLFGQELRLTGLTVNGARRRGDLLQVRAGALLGITTEWQVLEAPPPLSFSLRLQDAAGWTWLADDYVPLDGASPTQAWRPGETGLDRHGLLLPADLPPGPYAVKLLLYDAPSGVPLGGDAESEPVLLASLNVLNAAVAPDPQDLPIEVREDQPFGSELTLLGWRITPEPVPVQSGGLLTVWWQVVERPTQAYSVQIRLIDKNGRPAGETLASLSLAATDTWRPGQVVREPYRLTPDANAASGSYRLQFSLAAAGGALLGPSLVTGDVRLEARPRVYRLPQVQHSLDLRLGEVAELHGYDLALGEENAREIQLTLYWQSTSAGSRGYKVFVHLLDARGDLAGQADDVPAAGAAPVESWLPGEVIADSHRLEAPGSGRYRLEVGLYDAVTGERLPVLDAAGQYVPENVIDLGEFAIP